MGSSASTRVTRGSGRRPGGSSPDPASREATAPAARPDRFFVPWLVLASACVGAMWLVPGEETVPYHIGWAAFALAYGTTVWSTARTVLGLALFTLLTGGILVVRAAQELIPWDETAEIPLMFMLVALLVWSIRRGTASLATVTAFAERERKQAAERERLTRLTSHEMRTPLTIARGYVESLRDRTTDGELLRDLEVVDDELVRLTRVAERLLRVILLETSSAPELVDVDAVLRQTAQRWATVADRTWVVEESVGIVQGFSERLRVCLDTLVENSVRYTAPGDTIRIFGVRTASGIRLGVADSGPGLKEAQLELLNRTGSLEGFADPTNRDELSQTGLGLGLVRSVATARGGRLYADRAPEGGALLVLEIPDSRHGVARSGQR